MVKDTKSAQTKKPAKAVKPKASLWKKLFLC
jgi:hypothetical protein